MDLKPDDSFQEVNKYFFEEIDIFVSLKLSQPKLNSNYLNDIFNIENKKLIL